MFRGATRTIIEEECFFVHADNRRAKLREVEGDLKEADQIVSISFLACNEEAVKEGLIDKVATVLMHIIS